MGRKTRFSKDEKIIICKAYDDGKGSFLSLAKSIGVNKETIRRWYYRYKKNGEEAFKVSNKNKTYSKEFKDMVVNEYINNNTSSIDLSAKYNIDESNISRWIKMYYNGIDNKAYAPKSEVYTMKSRKTTYEERLAIVKEVLDSDMNYGLIADKYAIKYALVYQWTQKYLKNGEKALEYSKRGRKPKNLMNENLSELELLKLELAKEKASRERLELQVELLKKKEQMELEAYRKLGKK